jgi:thymidylate synthase
MIEQQLNYVYIDAFDLDDAWFQALSSILDKGYVYKITRGSYEGQHRLEFDGVTIRVRNPKNQIIPIIPEGMSIPPPTDMNYVSGDYLMYLMTDQKTKTEDYTYGERLNNFKIRIQKDVIEGDGFAHKALEKEEIHEGTNQIQETINMFKRSGAGTNQATMEIGMPSDIKLTEPPCLRLIDCRMRYGKLHFFIYFRSWDLWGGFPSNLGGIQLLKQYMAEQIGCQDGEMVLMSKGLHLYEYVWEYAKLRTGKTGLTIKLPE